MKLGFLPHSMNPAFAGVRLRCLIPNGVLRSQGRNVGIGLPSARARPDVLVVQAKWLLDAGSAAALQQRMATLRSLRAAGVQLVLDSFDNYFLNEGQDPQRTELLAAYRSCLGGFDAFFVSSPGLAPLLARETPPDARIVVIGDPVESAGTERLYESMLQRINPRRWPAWLRARQAARSIRAARHERRQLIWFGNHGSRYATGGMRELQRLLPRLADAARVVPLQLNIFSNSPQTYREVTTSAAFAHAYWPWDRLYFPALLAEHDLALLPSSGSAFAVAKSNNRLLLSLSCGVPVAADGLPDYLPWREHFELSPWDRLPQLLQDLSSARTRAASASGLIARGHGAVAVADLWWRTCAAVADGSLPPQDRGGSSPPAKPQHTCNEPLA